MIRYDEETIHLWDPGPISPKVARSRKHPKNWMWGVRAVLAMLGLWLTLYAVAYAGAVAAETFNRNIASRTHNCAVCRDILRKQALKREEILKQCDIMPAGEAKL